MVALRAFDLHCGLGLRDAQWFKKRMLLWHNKMERRMLFYCFTVMICYAYMEENFYLV